MTEFFNTGLSEQQFLDEYWQKKPLLMRGALSHFHSPITPNELITLACDDEIEARLIQENGPDNRWQLKNHALNEKDFKRLPETHWTVLVQDVDKHHIELQRLIDPFRFIPDWRRDDLMISYASKDGSVGAHIDSYDVFLLQAMGTRRWQISDHPIYDPEFIEGIDLQVLKHFTPDLSWDLAPGDCLYLPPHYAHHGMALDDCMTFSFGYRSPTKVELLGGITDAMLENEVGHERYSDPQLIISKHSHEISQQAIQEVKQQLQTAINAADAEIALGLGRLVTDTKSSLIEKTEQMLTDLPNAQECSNLFVQGKILKRNVFCRFAWSDQHQGTILFCAGEAYLLDQREHAIILSEGDVITAEQWSQLGSNDQFAEILCELIAEGAWIWSAA